MRSAVTPLVVAVAAPLPLSVGVDLFLELSLGLTLRLGLCLGTSDAVPYATRTAERVHSASVLIALYDLDKPSGVEDITTYVVDSSLPFCHLTKASGG